MRAHADAELSAQADRSGYAFQPRVKDLLHYVDMRGMVRALVPADTDADAGAATPSAAEAQAARLAGALQVPPFASVLSAEAAAALRAGDADPLLDACAALELAPGSAMLLSDDAAAVGAARRASLVTCYVAKRLAGRPARIHADFCVADVADVQRRIEDLNGVTYRTCSTEVHSRYVGGD